MNVEILHTVKNLPQILQDSYREYLENFTYEFQDREDSYFLTLIHEWRGTKGWNDSRPLLCGNSFDEVDKCKQFKDYGFAKLKGRSWSYVMKKPHIIIGRSCLSTETAYTWQVDLDLAPAEKVKRPVIQSARSPQSQPL